MKTLIYLIVLLLIAGLLACEKYKTEYTIKGYMYQGENKFPNRNQEFEVHTYSTVSNSHKYRQEVFLGTTKSDENGFIEFNYTHQRKGEYIMFTQDWGMNYYGEQFLIPKNQNITREFYYPPHGWVDVFLNTNNKLKDEDTFFIRPYHIQSYPPIDTIFGNHNGFVRRIRTVNSPLEIRGGKGEIGLLGEPGFWLSEIRLREIPITGHPHIDSIYIEY
jgi:hypothetical protein